MKNITPADLKKALDAGTPIDLVDLQDQDLYRHSHIPGAINIPFDQFEQYYPGTLKDREAMIVLHGEFDELGKGAKAAEALEAAGYINVSRIVGGLRGWQEAGFPTEGGWES
ncbi:MAG: rhodanese-like domain-containing protein [bacterium]